MDAILINILAILIPALLDYFIWYAIYEYTGIDYGKSIMVILIGIISFVPLIFVVFHLSFHSEFYQRYLDFTTEYFINSIMGIVIGYILSRDFNSC